MIVDGLPARLKASGLPVSRTVELVQPEFRFECRTMHTEHEVVEAACAGGLDCESLLRIRVQNDTIFVVLAPQNPTTGSCP
jgi:hypothetical protein